MIGNGIILTKGGGNYSTSKFSEFMKISASKYRKPSPGRHGSERRVALHFQRQNGVRPVYAKRPSIGTMGSGVGFRASLRQIALAARRPVNTAASIRKTGASTFTQSPAR